MFPDITRDDIFRLETSRLWLRWLRASDAQPLAAFVSLASVAQMTASIPHPYPPGEGDRFTLTARAATAAGNALILGVTAKNKARTLIGIASAQAVGTHEVEVGYLIAPSHTGRGYATEAIGMLLDAVFNLSEARVATATSRVGNIASRRVLEKCGFTCLETGLKNLPARGGLHPCDFFSLDRRQWLARGKAKTLPAMAHQALRAPLDGGGERSE